MKDAHRLRCSRFARVVGAGLAVGVVFSLPAFAHDDRGRKDCDGTEAIALVNGKIHTMDANDRVVSSVLIRNGNFVEVGRGGGDRDEGCTKVINLRGRTAIPGIIDNHNHIVLLGLRPGFDTRLENANSIQEAVDTLAAKTKEVPKGEWITSLGGINRNQFVPPPDPARFPNLLELDPVTPDHPVLIFESFTGPSQTNGKGKAYLTDPARGANVVTVNADGTIASGTNSLKALFLLRDLYKQLDDQKRGLQDAMAYAAQVGVTTHIDQGGFPFLDTRFENPGDPAQGLANFDRYRSFDSVQALYAEGKLINRIQINFLHLEDAVDTPELIARLNNVFPLSGNRWLQIGGIGEFTANGYAQASQQWKNGTRKVAKFGWRNENHSLSADRLDGTAKGDFKVIIDEWEKVNAELKTVGIDGVVNPDGITKLRWVVAHVPFIDTPYLDKLKALGGGISLVGGWRWLSGNNNVSGATGKTNNGPPFRTVLASGIRSGLSSDGMQISPMNPWIGIYYAVTGKNARGELINGNETITRHEALRLYTADNGWFLHMEDKVGTIEEGKWADLIVLNDDYFNAGAVTDEEIKDVRSVLTIVNGKIVHDDLDGKMKKYWARDWRHEHGFYRRGR